MKLKNLKEKQWNSTLLSFLFTFIAFLVVMLAKGMVPFGDSSMLYSDAYHQYYPFFVDFRRAILSGDSLLYTWSIGMGLDYLSLIAYYLASPLNLLSILVPESLLLHYFSLLVPIRLALASAFFSLMLKKLYGKDDIATALFGCFYGLCAWAMAYLWNIMWVDTFALLPLVVLGMVKLLTERKFLLYTITLFLSVFANYYIGLFTCIFVLLAFFCYEICRWEGFKKFFADLLFMGIFSVLAIGMTAILELPAFAALQNTQSSVNSFPKEFRLNMTSEHTWKGLLKTMVKVAGNMNGGLEPSFKEGLPNLYCGLFANAFALLFLLSKDIKLRDKVCALLLVLFFNVSFIIRQLDYIWHGFHFTNMIPYRFSFLHSFVWLWMAYRAWLVRRHFRLWQVITAGLLAIALAALSESRTDTLYLAYNGAFLLLYISILVYTHYIKKLPQDADPETTRNWLDSLRTRRNYGKAAMCIVIALEMALNLVNFATAFPGTNVSYYPRAGKYSASMIRYMHEREWDELFFRAEATHAQTLNDSALNGYNGISTFTSSANVNVTKFMKRLGYGAKETYNRYCYEESSPVSNLFLGIKYMLERTGRVEENPFFNDLHSYGDVHLLENNVYLPLGFLAEPELAEFDFGSPLSDFDFQNDLFTAATGVAENVWSYHYNPVITAADAELTSIESFGSCNYTTGDASGRVNYQFQIETEGFMCITLDLKNRNNFTVWLNGTELYSETYSIPQTAAVCHVRPGDVVDIALSCKANESGNIRVYGAILNENLFLEGYRKLAVSTLDLTTFENTFVEGDILCNRDGLLYTSIPQDGNWTAYVDGEIAEVTLVGDAMIGIPITKGLHTVTFVYRNPAFSIGWKISVLCALVVAGLALWIYPTRKKKGKFTH